MKKATLLGLACALFCGAQLASAQEVQEVTFVTDPGQGVLVNRMQDNWFITGEIGGDVYASKYWSARKFSDRFMPAAGIYVGKWFSPVFGARVGLNYLTLKGMSEGIYTGSRPNDNRVNGYYKTKYYELGPQADLMVNLTNWWCGYNPNRVYNAIVYGGAGTYATFISKDFDRGGNWIFDLRAGLLNQFRVSKHFQLGLDLRVTAVAGLRNNASPNPKYYAGQAYLTLTYNFNNTTWNAPVVPVYPEPENCDALRARLAAADARITDLERQLKECLSRPVETVEVLKAPLATVYYPIGVSRLSRENQRVVKAIAYVMQQNPDKKYLLTGWADNYTGTDAINIRLRQNRVDGVKNLLVKSGVNASQLEATTNNGNLSDLGIKAVALDRAVTIEEK